jgi:hypothetical protein
MISIRESLSQHPIRDRFEKAATAWAQPSALCALNNASNMPLFSPGTLIMPDWFILPSVALKWSIYEPSGNNAQVLAPMQLNIICYDFDLI